MLVRASEKSVTVEAVAPRSNPVQLMLLASLVIAGCSKPGPSADSCVEGEATQLTVGLAPGPKLHFGGVAISDDSDGSAVIHFDPLMDYATNPPRSHQEASGPMRYLLCEQGLVVTYPDRGTGAEDAPLNDAVTFFVPLSRIVSFETN